jgi:hypothetical protein
MNPKRKTGIMAGGVLLAAGFLAVNANAEPVAWDTTKAFAGGNGCNSTGPFPDAWFIAAGGDVSVIFSRMGVDLTPATAANTAVTSCLVRIPVVFDASIALARLEQTLWWGYAKDLGTEADLGVNATFCTVPTKSISGYVGKAIQGVQALIDSRVSNTYLISAPYCQGHKVSCLYQAQLAVAARRDPCKDKCQDISVRIFGEDIELETYVYWVHC